jgi:hypothetical protein
MGSSQIWKTLVIDDFLINLVSFATLNFGNAREK